MSRSKTGCGQCWSERARAGRRQSEDIQRVWYNFDCIKYRSYQVKSYLNITSLDTLYHTSPHRRLHVPWRMQTTVLLHREWDLIKNAPFPHIQRVLQFVIIAPSTI